MADEAVDCLGYTSFTLHTSQGTGWKQSCRMIENNEGHLLFFLDSSKALVAKQVDNGTLRRIMKASLSLFLSSRLSRAQNLNQVIPDNISSNQTNLIKAFKAA